VRLPAACSPILATLSNVFPDWRAAHRQGLALWVYGVLNARSACEARVITTLQMSGSRRETVRQYLREWLRDGADKIAPCASEVAVPAAFPPLLAWARTLWHGREALLAIDATQRRQEVTSLVISLLYRSRAAPLCWAVQAARAAHSYGAALEPLIAQVGTAFPRRTIVLTDRGLWSPRLWRALRAAGLHPLMRVTHEIRVAVGPRQWCPAAALVQHPGQAWVGRAVVHRAAQRRLWATVVVVWEQGQAAPWVLLTDLPPRVVGVRWYGLRMWIECGFRDCKHFGWDWGHTRRTAPSRVSRHWLVLAVATLLTLAAGTTVEDAGHSAGVPPAARTGLRPVSVFQLGLAKLQALFRGDGAWPALALWPEPWPVPPPTLVITYHPTPPSAAWTHAYLPL